MHHSRHARNAQRRSIAWYQAGQDSLISLMDMAILAVVLWSRQVGPVADVKSAAVHRTVRSEK